MSVENIKDISKNREREDVINERLLFEFATHCVVDLDKLLRIFFEIMKFDWRIKYVFKANTY